jgi:hypothetical protein
MEQIKVIFTKLEKRVISIEQAQKQVLDLFAVMPSLPVVDKGFGLSRPEQWVIDTHKEELEDLRYFRQRYFDFWEWYENNYPHTEKELWDEFESNEA